MRAVYLAFLILFVAAVGLFAYQNLDPVTLQFLGQGITASLAAVIAVVYVLGMLTGWTVVGLLRRSVSRVTEHRHPTAAGR